MEKLVHGISDLNDIVNNFVWGPLMLAFFLFVGLMFSWRTGFFQITKMKVWLSNTILACFHKKEVTRSTEEKSISQWQALTTALASTLGTGNIAGVATALTIGGPGAIFWMWVSAFLGMMTHYAETVLGLHYRYKNETGSWVGGPMIYIEKGLHCKWLACIFSIFCAIAALGIGNMSQSNSVASALNSTFGTSKLLVGVAAAVVVSLVIVGGIKRIAIVSEKLVPFMAVIFMLGAVVIIITHIENVPEAFASIFREAFNFRSAGSGVLGYGISVAMKKGISRGVFSNEAGLGSSVMVHAEADVKEPVVQGMWGIFEVFMDTLVMCSVTALTILCSGVYEQSDYLAAIALDAQAGGTQFFDALPNGVPLTAQAFATVFGNAGSIFVSVSIVLFAFSSLIGWSYFGERAVTYLFGNRSVPIFKAVYAGFIVIGAVSRLEFVWSISDTFNGLMAIPNLIAITLLSKKVIDLTKDYKKRHHL